LREREKELATLRAEVAALEKLVGPADNGTPICSHRSWTASRSHPVMRQRSAQRSANRWKPPRSRCTTILG
jgi:hypothetical protein